MLAISHVREMTYLPGTLKLGLESKSFGTGKLGLNALSQRELVFLGMCHGNRVELELRHVFIDHASLPCAVHGDGMFTALYIQ